MHTCSLLRASSILHCCAVSTVSLASSASVAPPSHARNSEGASSTTAMARVCTLYTSWPQVSRSLLMPQAAALKVLGVGYM